MRFSNRHSSHFISPRPTSPPSLLPLAATGCQSALPSISSLSLYPPTHFFFTSGVLSLIYSLLTNGKTPAQPDNPATPSVMVYKCNCVCGWTTHQPPPSINSPLWTNLTNLASPTCHYQQLILLSLCFYHFGSARILCVSTGCGHNKTGPWEVVSAILSQAIPDEVQNLFCLLVWKETGVMIAVMVTFIAKLPSIVFYCRWCVNVRVANVFSAYIFQ